jgi:hypothetical protein
MTIGCSQRPRWPTDPEPKLFEVARNKPPRTSGPAVPIMERLLFFNLYECLIEKVRYILHVFAKQAIPSL